MARILKIDSKKDSDFLRAKASSLELEKITVKEINELAKEMRQIMKKAFGVGLSANQIGKNMRLFVAQMPEQNGQKSGRFYTGYTHDLRKRFNKHNEGKSTYTETRGPYKLVYYEACLDEEDARSRELYLKSERGKSYIKSRLKRFLFRTG